MGARVVILVVGSVVVACRHPAPARPVIAATPTLEVGATGPSADADCVATCSAQHPSPPDAAGYRDYCVARCAPVDEPNPDCAADCRASHEPGGYLDDDGEYQTNEDPRDDDQRAADGLACDQECAHVPALDAESMSACVGACVADGGGESSCQADCDPDPYDTCRYQPCD